MRVDLGNRYRINKREKTNFKREYSIETVIDEEVQNYIEEYAAVNGRQVSEVLRKLSFSASALNYMGIQSPFHITTEMVQNEKYFDDLFSRWYEGQKNEKKVII